MKFILDIPDEQMDSMEARFIRITPKLLRDRNIIPYRASIEYIGGSLPCYAAITHMVNELPQSDYDRAQVLREEWEPTILHQPIWVITPSGKIIFSCAWYVDQPQYYRGERYKGYAFAPTSELAEEILAIREGKWIPKDGDFFCWCHKDTFYYESPYQAVCTPGFEFNSKNILFPSWKRRDAFIAEHKQPHIAYCLIDRASQNEKMKKIRSFFETICPLNDSRLNVIYDALFGIEEPETLTGTPTATYQDGFLRGKEIGYCKGADEGYAKARKEYAERIVKSLLNIT